MARHQSPLGRPARRPAAKRRATLAVLSLSVLGCARGLGPGAGGPLPPGPGSNTPVASLAGVRAAVAGQGSIHVSWRPASPGLEAALFVGTDRGSLFQETPLALGPSETGRTLGGLADGVVHYVALGLRRGGESAYEPAGLALAVRPGAPIYVDAAADPATADGTSPATAFADLRTALFTALLAGGGNVWVRGGRYEEAGLPLGAGTHAYGGFDEAFDPERRDLLSTVVAVPGGAPGVGVQGGAAAAVLDGFVLEGSGAATIGVDVIDAELELRSVSVRGFLDRGIRVRNAANELALRLVDCDVSFNGADGLSGSGPLDLFVDGCRFVGNVQEGVELDDLVAFSGRTARCVLRASLFAGNGAEGFDVDLAAGFPPLPPAGAFDVDVAACSFVGNAGDGLLVDQDHEGAPGWSARVSIRGCVARANRGSGIRLDADAEGSHTIERTVCTANRLDGLRVDSEASPGLVAVGGCYLAGNAGAGLRAAGGNRVVSLAHGVVAGNGQAGVVGEVLEVSVLSSIAWVQPSPWSGARAAGSLVFEGALVRVLERLPEAWLPVTAGQGTSLSVGASATSVLPGATVELDDDGLALRVVAVRSDELELESAPAALDPPASLAVFDALPDAAEDLRPVDGSPALGAGLAPAGASVDAGPFGAPVPGPPGTLEEPLGQPLALLGVEPLPGATLDALQPIELRFSDELDPGSVDGTGVRALDARGQELSIGLSVSGASVLVLPPLAGWPAGGFGLVLQEGPRSAGGALLHVPVALAY